MRERMRKTDSRWKCASDEREHLLENEASKRLAREVDAEGRVRLQ